MEGCVDMRRCSLGQRFGRERPSPAFIVPQLPVISNSREMHDQRMFLPHQHQAERKGRQLGLTVHIKINGITLLPSMFVAICPECKLSATKPLLPTFSAIETANSILAVFCLNVKPQLSNCTYRIINLSYYFLLLTLMTLAPRPTSRI